MGEGWRIGEWQSELNWQGSHHCGQFKLLVTFGIDHIENCEVWSERQLRCYFSRQAKWTLPFSMCDHIGHPKLHEQLSLGLFSMIQAHSPISPWHRAFWCQFLTTILSLYYSKHRCPIKNSHNTKHSITNAELTCILAKYWHMYKSIPHVLHKLLFNRYSSFKVSRQILRVKLAQTPTQQNRISGDIHMLLLPCSIHSGYSTLLQCTFRDYYCDWADWSFSATI